MKYRTTGAWGAGNGGPLAAADVDNNFYELYERAVDLLENPTLPVNIASITQSGDSIYVIMTDATEYGPFEMPSEPFNWRGEWATETAYTRLDIVYVELWGVFVVLRDHTSAATFNMIESTPEGLIYQRLFADTKFYDIGFSAPGDLVDTTVYPLFQIVAPRPFLIGTTDNGNAYLGTANTTEQSFNILKNGGIVGTITFGADTQAGVIAIPGSIQMAAGDVLSIELEPDTDIVDGANFSMTLKAVRWL